MPTTNPLLKEFDTPSFSAIQPEHFIPSIKNAIQKAKEEIQDIVVQQVKTFTNTIAALDQAGEHLERISLLIFNLNSAETNEQLQEITKEISQLWSDYNNEVLTNPKLFDAIKKIYQTKEQLNLTTEQQTLLEKNYKSFVRNGAKLNTKEKLVLKEIDSRLSKLSLDFGQKVLADTNDYQLHITDKKQLEGLPKDLLQMAKENAKQNQKKGYVFTLQYPSYIPFMKFCKNREFRKQFSIAFGKIGFQNNNNNNENLIKTILQLRYQRAKLLGYDSHAHYILEERMAKSPENVYAFLQKLQKNAIKAAQKELKELTRFAKSKDDIDKLQKWDIAYYTEKLKQEKYNLDENILKKYFSLHNTLQGAFIIAKKLYGLHFKEVNSVEVYHKDVKAYEVYNVDNTYKALLFTDFYPRKGKRSGAWMTMYKNQYKYGDKNSRPQVSIVCNFTKPTKDKPALLSFNEVKTLFHEFGHALHGILANTTYRSLSGPSVYWDFVELPSQILENWCYQKEALDLFAKHYQTEEALPQAYITQIKSAANFNEGMQTLRQIGFAKLDMLWHTANPSSIGTIKDFEKKALYETQLVEDVKENCMSTAFSHIFQGGYAAGYYSYKWAEVLDADAFELFEEKGIFNPNTAKAFEDNILSQGGTDKPMTLYRKFRGKEPDPNALLKRAGLL